MKELSIEEKAKRYDKALEIAREWSETKNGYYMPKELCKEIFPELRESEDERIRKELLEHCKNQAKPYIQTGNKCPQIQSWIAWLEKQSTPQVRTGLEWVNTIDDACDKRYSEEYAHGEYCHEQSFKWGFQEGVEWLEKQGEQKPANKVEPKFKVGDIVRLKNGDGLEWTVEEVLNNGYYTIVCADRDDFILLDDNWELVEQKPAWSEEDEYYFGIIQYILNNECVGKADRENATTWFKSLKDRVQPKQEWSEEDDILLNDAIYTIKEGERFENELKHENCHDSHTYQVIISWLKSLKERVQPQNSSVTDEELAQAKKEAYNEALDKIEYNSGEPTFDDGWSAAIWYLKKRNGKPQNERRVMVWK